MSTTPARPWPPTPDDVMAAFLRDLNAKRNARYEIVERPDTKERTKRDIDYLLRDHETRHEIAVEVSSIWRSKAAGKEDKYIERWFEVVRARVVDRVEGVFHITVPIRVPKGLDASAFGDALAAVIHGNAGALARYRGRSLAFNISGVSVRVSRVPNKTGSLIDYARVMPEMSEFPTRAAKCLDDKAAKLTRYSEVGLETYIVIYNTMGIAMSYMEAVDITRAQCGPAHAHVTHIVLVAGTPPDDAWIEVVR